jgi:hypothetical protein
VAGGIGLKLVDRTGFSISGSGVEFDPKTYQSKTTGAGTPYILLKLTAHADAPLGPRTLVAARGDERAVLTGAIEVVAP